VFTLPKCLRPALQRFLISNSKTSIKKLFKSLLLAGVAGSVTGAYLLSDVIDGNVIKPYIAFYMLILGIIIIRKAIQKKRVKNKTRRIGILAATGGFLNLKLLTFLNSTRLFD